MTPQSLKSLVTLFNGDRHTVEESLAEVNIQIGSVAIEGFSADALLAALNLLSHRDKILVSVFFGDNDPLELNGIPKYKEFTEEILRTNEIRDEEEITVRIKIKKPLDFGVISIYSVDQLSVFLESLSLIALISEFDKLIKKEGYLIFEVQSPVEESRSDSIWIVNRNFSGSPTKLERALASDRAKTSCHFNLLPTLTLVPEDFRFSNSDVGPIGKVFRRLSIVLSVAFLFDITIIDEVNFQYKINGYKSISGTVDIGGLNDDLEEQYFKIYEWVYTSGNFNDKIGLARNIISLHLENRGSLLLKGDPFQSIKSSYKVYEKQNIKQYIEIRNKISDQLLSFHDRANRIVETFASGFQKSALALITFYTTTIVLRILNNNELVGVFTIDAAVLSSTFLLCSAGYYFLLTWEVSAQRKRFEENYGDIKLRYTDLLDTQDISRILNNDREYKRDLEFMDNKARYYNLLWVYFLVVLLATTWLLYFLYNPFPMDIGFFFRKGDFRITSFLWYRI